MQNAFNKINKFLDISKVNDVNAKVNSTDGSFTILTDEILEATTNNSEAYTFRIETPIHPEATFENFVLERRGEQENFHIYIYSYKTIIFQDNSEFNLLFAMQEIDLALIDIDNLLGYLNSRILAIVDGCLTYVDDFGGPVGEPVWCFDNNGSGGFGSSSGSNGTAGTSSNYTGSWFYTLSSSGFCNRSRTLYYTIGPASSNSTTSISTVHILTQTEYNVECPSYMNSDGEYDPHFNDVLTNTTSGSATNSGNTSTVGALPPKTIDYAQKILDCLSPDFNIQVWMQNQDNFFAVRDISTYLSNNSPNSSSCPSLEVLAFAEEAMEAIMEGGEVDFEDNIIFHESFNDYPCQKNIIDGVYQKDTAITNLFQNIFDNGDTHNITFIPNPNSASSGTNQQGSNNTNYDISIGSAALNCTDLMLATTTVHEALHASLSHIYHYTNTFIINNIPSGQEPTYLQLVNAYMESQVGTGANAEHEFMQDYREHIAQAVYTWATTPVNQEGGGYTTNQNLLTHLQRLAWAGLQYEQGNYPNPTTEWENFINDSSNSEEVLEINLIIEAEYNPDDVFYYDNNGTQYNLDNIRKGTGC